MTQCELNAKDLLLSEIKKKKYKVITTEEQLYLFNRVRTENCKKSRDKLIESNTKFVIKVGNQFKNSGADMLDIWSEGFHGLAVAVDKFDVSMDCAFYSYAVWWIKHYIILHLSKDNKLKIPVAKIKMIYGKMKDNVDVRDIIGDDPALIDAYNAIQSTVDINGSSDSIDDDSSSLFGESLADETATSPEVDAVTIIYNNEIHKIIKESLNSISADIIMRYYGIGKYGVSHTYRELGELLNLSHERVRQLKVKAEKTLVTSGKLKYINNKYIKLERNS